MGWGIKNNRNQQNNKGMLSSFNNVIMTVQTCRFML